MNRFDPDYFPQPAFGAPRSRAYCHRVCSADILQSNGLGADAVTCYGGNPFGSGNKLQTTLNTQTGGSEDAQVITGAGSVSGKDDSVTLGGSFNTNKINTGVTTEAGANTNLGGVSLGGANSGQITINGAAGVAEAQGKFNDTLKAITSQTSDTVDNALSKVASLSESRQTEGISSLGKIALWGLGIIAAGLLGFSLLTKLGKKA